MHHDLLKRVNPRDDWRPEPRATFGASPNWFHSLLAKCLQLYKQWFETTFNFKTVDLPLKISIPENLALGVSGSIPLQLQATP